MKRTPVRRHVDDLARLLFAPLIAPPTEPKTWKLLGWDAEQGFTLFVERGKHVLLIELEDRDETLDCYARTARFNVCVRWQFEREHPLTSSDHKFVNGVVRMVSAREGLLPNPERQTTSRRSSAREILVDRVLIAEGRGHYYVNPYVGCMIGCDFCYVARRADMSRRLEGLPQLEWGRYVDVKVNAAEVLRAEVARNEPGVVRMSPILTDPYQGLERKYRITRACLEVLLEADFTPVILTRATRVCEDLDLLARFSKASVGFSIPTDDDHWRAIFEPGADPVEERFTALRRCHEAGLHTMVVVQPMLPMDVDRFVDRVAPFADVVRVDRLYFGDRVSHLYREHDIEWASEDSFYEETAQQLLQRFRERGLKIDEMDDLARLL